MRREKVLAVGLVILTIGFMACQKQTDVPRTGPSSLQVQIQALNPSYSLPVQGNKAAMAGSSTISWDTAQMVVSNVKFEAELKSQVTHQDSIEISYKWTGPVLANMMDSTVTFGDFVLQPGFYDQIQIWVNGNRQDAGDQPVFYLHGIYSSDTTTIPVKVEVNKNVSFKTKKDSIIVTSEAFDFTSYIQLYLDDLLTGITPSAFDNATLTDGVIVISEIKNRDIYQMIMSNLVRDHQCYFYFWDKYGDHNHKNHYGGHDD